MSEEKILELITYMVEVGIIKAADLNYTHDDLMSEIHLETPYGRVRMDENGDEPEEYQGEGEWKGTAEFARTFGDTEYSLGVVSKYHGMDYDDLLLTDLDEVEWLVKKQIRKK